MLSRDQAQAIVDQAVVGAAGVTVIGGFPPITVQQLLNPTPGLGFDFPHLAAINRSLDLQALIDPITQLRLAQAERLLRETPVVPVVSPFFGAAAPVVVVESPPAQVVVVQQPAAAEQPSVAKAESQSQPAITAAPLPDAGEFVLVHRDGSVTFAVAFAQRGNRITYVTREGNRRSLALDDLDLDSTERMNEERGTTLQLSL